MSAEAKRTIVLHARDAAQDVAGAAGTADRLRTAFPGAEVRVIVNGAALDGVTGSDPMPDGIEACAYGMTQRGISAEDLAPGVRIVPSAAEAIAAAQWSGAAYLRM